MRVAQPHAPIPLWFGGADQTRQTFVPALRQSAVARRQLAWPPEPAAERIAAALQYRVTIPTTRAPVKSMPRTR
jgi:hypothetical protein